MGRCPWRWGTHGGTPQTSKSQPRAKRGRFRSVAGVWKDESGPTMNQQGFDVFLSYNRRDRRVVERLAQVLSERGLRVFKDDWYLRPGQFWPAALEENLKASRAVAVAVGSNGLGAWQQREAIAAIERQHAEAKAGKFFPVIPVLLEAAGEQQAGLMFLEQNTWVEWGDPRAPDLIAGAVEGRAPAELYDEDHPDPRMRICPYRGLSVFREEDAAFYFGRDVFVGKLEEAVDRYPLVAVVGASGSGKSSLVRAGLIPRLRRRSREPVWQIAAMIPGGRPFLALARALLPLREPEKILQWSKGTIDDEAERLEQRLARDGASHLAHVVEQILQEERGTTRLLLLVDQWEELYTHRTGAGEAATTYGESVRDFIHMLRVGVQQAPLQVVLTLRADFWGEVLNDPPLAGQLPDAAIVHLRPMDRSALEEAIRRPAEAVRLSVPNDLVEVLLDAACGQPGDLPLLEFTLQQLWNQRSAAASALTLASYRALGGLEKSIVNHADTVYRTLGPEEQGAVPGVFAALVQVGEARADLRRRAPLAELSEAGRRVARRLADKRLLVTSRDWSSGEEVVEVAHEALLRHWPELDGWIRERRDALLTVRQLQADARHWREHGKPAHYLWSHERAREARSALDQVGAEVVLSDDEREVLGPVDAAAMLGELEQPTTSHRRRLLIGERLAVLGDLRSGVGVGKDGTPDVEWCDVPGGEVVIQAETPRRKRVEPFCIGRYPVTVSQYRAFIEAEDGWRERRWWGQDLFRDPDGDSYDFGRYPNHPALYVSWFDAVAFCRWLSARLGYQVRLPDEWAWQQAATGGDPSNVYPWGTDWDPKGQPHRANTFESRLGRPTAVGMYPAGAANADGNGELNPSCETTRRPLDMAGTVWEWCLNKFDSPEVTESCADDFGDRAWRGGSWFDDAHAARAAGRFAKHPADRDYVGCRVVRSSPISVKR